MNKLLAFVIAVAMAGRLYGQDNTIIGLKGGVNYDIFKTDEEGTETQTGFGYNVGLEMGYHPLTKLGIDIGVFYFITQYGAQIDGVDYSTTFKNIYVPASFRFLLVRSQNVISYVRLGGAAMFQLSGTTEVNGEKTDISDDALQTDWYVLGGLCVDIKTAPDIFVRPEIVVQYNLTADDDATDAKEQSGDLLLSLGFYHGL